MAILLARWPAGCSPEPPTASWDRRRRAGGGGGRLPRQPRRAAGPGAGARPPRQSQPFTETWRNIGFARENQPVFLAILGISWFWLYGALFLAQFPAYAKTLSAAARAR